MYGAGFSYVPGSDTCIKLGGFVRADTVLNSSSFVMTPVSGTAGANNRLSGTYTGRARVDLTMDTRTATEYGLGPRLLRNDS